MTGLQAALPRHHYVDPEAFRRERELVLLNSWTCVGRLDLLGLAHAGTGEAVPGRLAVVDLHGESALVTTTREGELLAHANVCRHRGSQVVPVDPALPAPEPCAVGALRCPYHSWTYDLDGRLIKAPAHRRRGGLRPCRLLAAPAGRGCLGRLPLAARDPCYRATPARRAGPGSRTGASLPARPARGRSATDLHGGRQLEGPRRELQRVLPLRAGPPRAHPAGARVRRRRSGPAVGGRHPAPRGRVDVHPVRNQRPVSRSPTSTRTSGSATRASSSTPTCSCRCPPTTWPRSP